MPVYDFHHAETNHTISVLVPLTATDKERAQQVQDGKVYKRVYAAPLAAKDLNPKDGTLSDYRRTTGEKNLTVGEAWEASREMSERRAAQHGGKDPVKEQFYRDYEKTNHGKHPDVKKREAQEANREKMKQWGIKVE